MAAYIMSVLLFNLVVILPSLPCQGALSLRAFWRRPTNKPKPTLLPPPDKDPEFYRKLREEIPPKKETAEKLVTNLLRITPGGKAKRSEKLEDLVIVMDGSGSIGQCEFDNGKKAMRNLMQYEKPGVNAKFAAVTFAYGVRRDFGFLPQLEARTKMSGVTFPSGSTNTQAGLAEALDLFATGSRGFNSKKIVLLLTDGHSNVDADKTIPNAQKLKDQGVDVFVVAVGGKHISGINEMAHVASFPPADFLFRVEKVKDFFDIVKLAIEKVSPSTYKILGDKYTSPC